MNVKICVTVTAINYQQLANRIMKAETSEADIIEIRLDFLKEESYIKKIRRLTTLPLIATNRTENEGGFFKGSEKKRIQLLLQADKAGFDFIDIELTTKGVEKIIKKVNAKPIVSSHNYESTPNMSRIRRILNREIEVGGEVCKIVTMAKTIQDNLTCLRFVKEMSKTKNLVCFCMGKLGILSRILSPLLGSAFTYVSLEHGMESAPGQITIAELRSIYRLMEI